MPDIRQTPKLDDFQRANEYPLSFDGRWSNADPGLWPTNLHVESFRCEGDPGDSVSYWTPTTINGDSEAWGRTGPGVDLTEAWRIGLMTDVGGSSVIDGYQLLVIADGGAASWIIREYTNGSFSNIAVAASQPEPNDDAYVLLRIDGDEVEAWFSSTNPPTTWTQILGVTDTTYRSNLRVVIGISSDDGANPTWEEVGGGHLEGDFVPQIWRKRRRHGSR